MVTGQVELDSYIDAGLLAAAGLVNALTPGYARGRPIGDIDALAAIKHVLAVDPPSAASVKKRDAPGFIELAQALRAVFEALDRGALDTAAQRLNALLARHPASPHLAKED